ncbi:MAG TPA: Hint domain-containing protein [Rhodopila sp.]|uniref:Hint domain-containing protein n=1 Tax=Rhodopila sp. TaxID=2480087 RepID=UPI002C7AB69B|nr:Hint domain-containing protein [Rhodopila sp.]HVY17992.1 Hint domain-containing protein [Rhodopila sp.]
MSDSISNLATFTPGDLVISVVGDGAGDGTYGDNQASPIVLEELTTSGSVVGDLVLPQTTAIVNGVTQYAISGEYGSSSEGSLQLSADGHSLVIAGYGVNAATYNSGGAAVYGNAALAQSTSIPGGPYTPVARVIADISASGAVNTSTALYNVFDLNNPRSVATVNGTTFYISGQGQKGSTNQGVFVADEGASSATGVDTSTDTRTVEIIDGKLYVSRDSTQGVGGTLSDYGATLPTGTTSASVLPGIDGSITLTAAQANGIDNADIGKSINLSPENFFFADADTLYIADGGDPKAGGLGDGGLQKWTFNGSVWTLDYTLTAGLDLVPDTATSGTTGLIGLAGTVVGGQVELYATNSTLGDLDQTYLFGISDTLAATALPTNESFNVLVTAAADTNIRGISFAPTAAVTTTSDTTVSSGSSSSGVQVTSGSILTVQSGGTAVSATIFSGASATIAAGGIDSGSYIAQGGQETVLGSAAADTVAGVQLVSAATAVVNDEIVLNGGTVELFLAGAIASNTTIDAGGALAISGHAVASNTTISGGLVELESPKAILSGSVTFVDAGTIDVTANTSVGYGDLGVISGFGVGDVIDFTSATAIGAAGSAATVTFANTGSTTTATVSGGGSTQAFTFAGSPASNLQLISDGRGGEELTYSATPPVSTTISSGSSQSDIPVTSGSIVDVLSGGTLISGSIAAGGTVTVEAGGLDLDSEISTSGFELVLGMATGDKVSGTQLVSAATAVVNNETVYSGGSIDLFLKGAVADDAVVMSGGQLNISGNATASNTTIDGGLIDLQSPKAVLAGTVTFAGAGTIAITDTTSAGFGDLAIINGFGSGDVIDLTIVGSGASLATTTSGGNTIATVTDGGVTESFIFAGSASGLQLVGDGNGGEELTTGGSASSSSSSSSSSSVTSVTSGMTESGLVVSGGFSVSVLNGGTIVGASILSGGSVTIQTGGVDSASVISAGGNETELGSAAGDQIYGTQLVSAATAVVSSETVYAGGNLDLFLKGAVSNNAVLRGGTLNINGNATAYDSVLTSGGLIDLQSPKAVLSGSVLFDGAGTLEVSDVSSAGYGDQAVISGFGAGDVIDDTVIGTGATFATTTSGGNTVATITSGSVTQSFTLAGDVGANLQLVGDGNGGEEIIPVLCFCAGTLIRTPAGEAPIERLAVGDRVITHTGAERPITWIGRGRVLATRGRRNAATPVIIRKSAFADNVPNRDLRVTKGHAFSFEGALIPIEFLVNHRSILWDDQAQEVELYHIELESHDVLLANGAAAESYRDDGNRWLFQNANSGWGLPPLEPCAPVLTGGRLVDEVWRRLLDRSGPRPSMTTTDDPDLHLVVDGERVEPINRRSELYVFRLPETPRALRIASRSAVPQELGIARDDRPLGVAIGRIVFSQAARQRVIDAADPRLVEGFHPFEAEGLVRWTNGDAILPESLFQDLSGACLLMLHLNGATTYRDDGKRRMVA